MSGYQVPALDSNLLASVSYELKEKERKQQKHYTLLQELQTMTREVPRFVHSESLSVNHQLVLFQCARADCGR